MYNPDVCIMKLQLKMVCYFKINVNGDKYGGAVPPISGADYDKVYQMYPGDATATACYIAV